MDHACRCDSRQARDTFGELTVVADKIQVLVSPRFGHKSDIEHSADAKSGVDSSQFFEISQKKSRSHDKNKGKRHLCDDERLSQPASPLTGRA